LIKALHFRAKKKIISNAFYLFAGRQKNMQALSISSVLFFKTALNLAEVLMRFCARIGPKKYKML
jgi:hypothetical protein